MATLFCQSRGDDVVDVHRHFDLRECLADVDHDRDGLRPRRILAGHGVDGVSQHGDVISTPIALTYFRERTLLMTSQLLFALSAVTLVTVTILEVSSSWYLLGFGLICAAFSVGFGVAMNQALSPFSFRAGIASSVIGVSQVCLSAAYIWIAGLLGLSAQNILIVSLGLCSVVCAALLLAIPKPARCASYEEIHYSS